MLERLYRRCRSIAARVSRSLLLSVLPHTPASLRCRMIPVLRFALGFQISAKAVATVRDRLMTGGRLLIFAIGLDSSTWELVNRRGRTVFLEDVPGWVDISRKEAPGREVHLVEYSTTVETSMGFSDVSDIPLPSLPDKVASTRWDVVVVDGPAGWGPDTPGRVASVTLAHRLVGRGGVVLVDDYEREIERHICDLVFGRPADKMLDTRRPVALFRC